MANQFATFFTIKPFYNESFSKLDLQERVPHRCYTVQIVFIHSQGQEKLFFFRKQKHARSCCWPTLTRLTTLSKKHLWFTYSV